jgi:hypothetical protein
MEKNQGFSQISVKVLSLTALATSLAKAVKDVVFKK